MYDIVKSDLRLIFHFAAPDQKIDLISFFVLFLSITCKMPADKIKDFPRVSGSFFFSYFLIYALIIMRGIKM